jgi:hypothetical protein
MNEKKPHFWIPDQETEQIPKSLTSRPQKRNVPFKEHGMKLSHNLQTIKSSIEQTALDNSFRDKDIFVFNVELPETIKVQHQDKLFESNGMQVRAVRNERNAIVTSTRSQFDSLVRRVESYTESGANKSYFDFVESFEPYIGSIKDSSDIKKIVSQETLPATVDVQLMLIPDFEHSIYESALQFLRTKIERIRGKMPEPVYYLSDNTPVIRAIIPSQAIPQFENDQAIYRIEETHFFSVDADSAPVMDIKNLVLNPETIIDDLSIVAVLDSGVAFPPNLESLIVQHWRAPDSKGGNAEHGTSVAGNAAFRYIQQNIRGNILTPRARILDCNILDGSVATQDFIKRIQTAVTVFSDAVKIYNLSANTKVTIEGDKMSIVGYELDILQMKKGVVFIISAGNHDLWKTQNSLKDIIDDDDSRISPPADSLHSIIVGAIVGENHKSSLSRKNEIAPYSRKGPGFRGLIKPDMSAYAATIASGITPQDPYSLVMTANGMLAPCVGTSYSAPIIAGDLAEIVKILPDSNILLAKAIMFHHAVPLWDTEDITDEEANFAHNLYGRGISNLDASLYSSQSKVSFVRTGILNRTTKERIKIYMPEILAAQAGRNIARVSITCVSAPPIDISKGTEYLGAYIRVSLKKNAGDDVNLIDVNPGTKESREKWDVCQYISKPFTTFHSGNWQVWLELFGRWQKKAEDVRYALVVTIEDMSGQLPIYNEIEVQNRYQPLNEIRIQVENN